jgi:hypothetical protein
MRWRDGVCSLANGGCKQHPEHKNLWDETALFPAGGLLSKGQFAERTGERGGRGAVEARWARAPALGCPTACCGRFDAIFEVVALSLQHTVRPSTIRPTMAGMV